jgi:hypothetical protein
MTDPGLTAQQLAALRTLAESGDLLLDLASRAAEKRARNGRTEASVQKHDWTPEQARMHGVRNSMRSVLRAHAQSEKALAAVQAEFDRTAAEVLMVRAQLDALIAELGLEEG